MRLGVTGHRPQSFDASQRNIAIRELRHELERHRPEHALTGMALGVDQWFAKLCVVAGIPFKAIVPFLAPCLVG